MLDGQVEGGFRFVDVPFENLDAVEEPPIEWVWEGFIGFGHTTLLTGRWKGGKTTLLSVLLKRLEADEPSTLISTVNPTRTMIISEERYGLWKARASEFGIQGRGKTSLLSLPYVHATVNNWRLLIEDLIARVQASDERWLFIFDPLQSLLPLEDENNSCDMRKALAFLTPLRQAGAAILLCHHPKKSADTDDTNAPRGSSYLTGHADFLLTLKVYTRNSSDKRRILTATGRHWITQPESVIELTNDWDYVFLGDPEEGYRQHRQQKVENYLPEGPPGLSAEEIRGRWSRDNGDGLPSERQLRRDLNLGAQDGRWVRVRGTGRGGPFMYYRRKEQPYERN